MKRRQFLKGAAAVGMAAGASSQFPAPAIAKGAIEWRMVTPWPRNTPGVGVNAQRLADKITEMSGGRLGVKLFAAGELVPPFECFDAVQTGTADMAHGSPYFWQGKSQAMHYFTGVPFGVTAWEMSAWLRFAGGQALWDELYAKFGLKPFYAGSSGVQAGGWFRKEIKGLDDLQGLKMRIAGLGGAVMRKLGVQVVLTPPGEIFPAMQSGVVDAAEWVGPWNDLAFGLHKIAKHYYAPSFHEGSAALECIVDRAKFDALPADLQKIIEYASAASAEEALADFTAHNARFLQVLVKEHGVQLHQWPADMVKALGKASREVLAELAATDEMTAKVSKSFTAYLTEAREWSRWSDQLFLSMRESAWNG